MRKEADFKQALEGKRLPVLTLDNKWHRLFSKIEPDKEIKDLEEELNALLRRQGKVNTETKDIKKLKKKLMGEIVSLTDAFQQNKSASIEKQIEDKKRLVEECNEKLEEYQDEMLDLPKLISEANYRLMLSTMELLSEILKQNSKELDETNEWIKQIRVELKKRMIRKQEMEMFEKEVYSYMHDIFGADVIEIFDLRYKSEEK